MKIAIYGDSFGFEEPIFVNYHNNVDLIGDSWSKMLRESFDVTNFSYPGSDLFFSYKNFIEHNSKYDLNIFIFTSPYRLSVVYKDEYLHNHGLASASAKYKQEKNKEKSKIFKASVDYFKYIQNDDRDKLVSDLIRKEIKGTQNTLLIDSFGPHGLFNVTLMENEVWNVSPSYTLEDPYIDIRFCHMTKRNNEILTEQIKYCIKHNMIYKFDINNFQPPSKEEKELYLVKK